MKEIDELLLPEVLRYTDDHEWARLDGEVIRVGISDYAQDQLGDITFVELPEVGAYFGKGEECGTLESTKAVAEMYMPLGGEILAVNEALEDEPELVNQDPYNQGWIIDLKPDDPGQLAELKDRAAYLELLKGL